MPDDGVTDNQPAPLTVETVVENGTVAEEELEVEIDTVWDDARVAFTAWLNERVAGEALRVVLEPTVRVTGTTVGAPPLAGVSVTLPV